MRADRHGCKTMIEFIDVADGNKLIEKKGVWPRMPVRVSMRARLDVAKHTCMLSVEKRVLLISPTRVRRAGRMRLVRY